MAIRPDWTIGKLTLVAGSKEFTAVGSALVQAAVQAGDEIITAAGDILIIETITGENSGTLYHPCPAASAGIEQPLRIRFQPDGSRYSAAARDLIEQLGNGNLYALSQLQGGVDKVPYFTGAGVMSLVDLSSLGGGGTGGGSWDALTGTLAGRDAFNGEAAGFRVLVADNGNGQAVIYQKTATGWSVPVPFTGAKGNDGQPNTLTVGSVTEGEQAHVSITGTSPNQIVNFVLRRGEKGVMGDVTPEGLAAKAAAEAAADAAEQDAARTAVDRIATGQDKTATAADRVVTTADKQATGQDKTAAAASASTASTKAGEAAADRVQTGLDRTAASGSATTATTKASEAAGSAASTAVDRTAVATDKSTVAADKATTVAARDKAQAWANAPEGQAVEAGQYSAYHWSKVAETAAGGGVQIVNGKTGSSITLTASDVGAATDAQGGKADTALQTLTAGTNITITGAGTGRTINATSAPQVQTDWNAASGMAAILNKPTLGTAASQNVGAFATAAQGAKADTAVQPLAIANFATKTELGGKFDKPTGTAAQYLDGQGAPKAFPAIPEQVQSDWNAASGVAAIKNKPALAAVATSGSYNDLLGRPTIPAPQVQSDWNAVSGLGEIANKPTTFPPSAHTHTKDQVGLGNVDNTSDAAKPVSTATQAALDTKASYNWIINPDFTINQRGGVKKPANGVYGFDRWKGHAAGIEQVIEVLPAGEYTLTWSGGGNGTFGGLTKVSPIKATVAGGNTSVVVPQTATKVSVVRGDASAKDPWQARFYQEELALCMRYYEVGGYDASGYQLAGGYGFGQAQAFVVTKRVTPTVSYIQSNSSNITGSGVEAYGTYGVKNKASVSTTGVFWSSGTFYADAEI